MAAAATKGKAVLASKTIWFSGALGAAGLLQLAGEVPWTTISPVWGGAVLLGIGAMTAALRTLTTQPLGK